MKPKPRRCSLTKQQKVIRKEFVVFTTVPAKASHILHHADTYDMCLIWNHQERRRKTAADGSTSTGNIEVILVVTSVHTQTSTCEGTPQNTIVGSIIAINISLNPGVSCLNDYRECSGRTLKRYGDFGTYKLDCKAG